ncbi:MAG: hypothetical protein AB1421_06815 [Pseudomonadota bacterium]
MSSHTATSNTLRASVSFSFKGETYDLETLLDLDQFQAEPGEQPDFHRPLAQAAGIDPYSYLYEVLEAEDILFSAPTGLACGALEDGVFHWERFEQLRRASADWQIVKSIAEVFLEGRGLDEDENLRAALLAVYQAGLKHS